MALTYNLKAIPPEIYKKFCVDPDGEHMSKLTEDIIFATPHVGIGVIRKDNVKKFIARLALWHKTWGDPERQWYPFSVEQVSAHIGMDTNVSNLSDAEFAEKIEEIKKRRANPAKKNPVPSIRIGSKLNGWKLSSKSPVTLTIKPLDIRGEVVHNLVVVDPVSGAGKKRVYALYDEAGSFTGERVVRPKTEWNSQLDTATKWANRTIGLSRSNPSTTKAAKKNPSAKKAASTRKRKGYTIRVDQSSGGLFAFAATHPEFQNFDSDYEFSTAAKAFGYVNRQIDKQEARKATSKMWGDIGMNPSKRKKNPSRQAGGFYIVDTRVGKVVAGPYSVREADMTLEESAGYDHATHQVMDERYLADLAFKAKRNPGKKKVAKKNPGKAVRRRPQPRDILGWEDHAPADLTPYYQKKIGGRVWYADMDSGCDPDETDNEFAPYFAIANDYQGNKTWFGYRTGDCDYKRLLIGLEKEIRKLMGMERGRARTMSAWREWTRHGSRRRLAMLTTSRKRSGLADNPKATKKVAKKPARKKTPEWQLLCNRCSKLWDHYCERPSKTRLKPVLEHLEKMKASTSKRVADERKACLRVANKEARRLKMK